MSTLSDQDRAWFYSHFLAFCIRKNGFDWQDFVTNLMQAKHGGDFIQVDPAGRGDKGCDGWVEGLHLACYGARSPNRNYVSRKIEGDFKSAFYYWGSVMRRWAFVHNNASGLPDMAALKIMTLRGTYQESGVTIEVWPPQEDVA